eukprot:GHRR01000570.1.p1 GENE.GHRR01000570.1~~GHRR01000570.1.p1  ORF type:complete len:236 (+),score=52.48 GHRR01000570.1:86-793(+)
MQPNTQLFAGSTMKYIATLLLLCGIASCAADAPWFCHELDCPNYSVVKNLTEVNPPVELRRYEAGKWASTVVAGAKYDKAVAKGFWRLFKYISGNNEESAKVEMTAPVTVRVIPAQGPFCEDNFTISFFVPFAFQSNPPKPSQEEVFIQHLPAQEVYVRGFGGWATGSTYVQEAANLTQDLEDSGYDINTDHFYTAGYDSPFRLRNRHNEIWIPAAKKPTNQVAGEGSHSTIIAA